MMAEGKFDADIVRLHEANPFLSNTDLVYTILRDQIVNHKLQPGKKLNQEQIAIDMNVSRTPVREAFFRLETEGFLEKGAQGYTVYEMTPGDYMMLLDVRIAIENWRRGWPARRCSVPSGGSLSRISVRRSACSQAASARRGTVILTSSIRRWPTGCFMKWGSWIMRFTG